MTKLKKIKTWKDNLNDVIRDVVFPDDDLLELMMIPEEDRENIVLFIDKYFIRDPGPDEIVTNEDVRICYSETQGQSLGSNVLRKYIFFDVYVKNDHLHDFDDDMLSFRTDKICQKLKENLTDETYVCRLRFSYVDDYSLFTKMIGYTRHRIVFSYKITF